MEDNRYRLMLFWKDVQDANLDKLFIRATSDLFSRGEQEQEETSEGEGEQREAENVGKGDEARETREAGSDGQKQEVGSEQGLEGSEGGSEHDQEASEASDVTRAYRVESVEKGDQSELVSLCEVLEDIYDKYVVRWTSSVAEPGVIDPSLPTMCHSRESSDRATLEDNINKLVAKLKPMHKKADRVLRFQLWPQFSKSEHYAALTEVRQQRSGTASVEDEKSQAKGQGRAFDFHTSARSLTSYLKQQPVTRDKLVIECGGNEAERLALLRRCVF
jgi:hypothetical protein